MTYVAAYPTKRTVYEDTRGNQYPSREEAIQSNFEADLNEALALAFRYVEENYDYATRLKAFAKENPDMLRIVLGDRTAT